MTDQELRNAVYAGSVGHRRQAALQQKRMVQRIRLASRSCQGSNAIRQKYLETAIKWISGGNIEDYMGRHQHAEDATELWDHFRRVIEWVESCFKTRPKLMRGVDWGALYDGHRNQPVDFDAAEAETLRLIDDDDVQKQRGIYAYILTRDERHLNIRVFSRAMKRRAYERQGGKCVLCGGRVRVGTDGSGPYHALDQGRQDGTRKLSGSLPGR